MQIPKTELAADSHQNTDDGSGYSRDASIQQLFSKQVACFPDKTAVIQPGENQTSCELTYQQLNQQSDQIAELLLNEGIVPGDCVGLCMDRTLELIVGMVGIIKAGGVYVPLDPGYPKERIQWILKDCEIQVVLSETKYSSVSESEGRKVFNLDEYDFTVNKDQKSEGFSAVVAGRPEDSSHGADPAYVNYTSGSTGKPKGVLIPHRGVTRLVRQAQYATFNEHTVLLQLATISFDAATFEVWGALLNGGCCVIFPQHGAPDPYRLKEVIETFNVTTAFVTTSIFNATIEEFPEAFKKLKELLSGGEAMSASHARKALRLLPDTKLINGYGPTENTTFSLCYTLPRDFPESRQTVPIGKPIAHSGAYILDDELKPVEDGIAGELCVSGDGLAIEYLNSAEQTSARFVAVPDLGIRVYRTGDQARMCDDGNFEYLGRFDDQIKLHGHRIEIGEIEAVLFQHSQINQAKVVLRELSAGQRALFAYVTCADDSALGEETIRHYLSEKIPAYMIPARIIRLERMPLNRNGKIDKNRLPDTEVKSAGVNNAPGSPLRSTAATESKLISLWSDLLNLKSVDPADHFFDLGGNSVMAIKFVARLGNEYSIKLPIVKLFQYPVLCDLAIAIDELGISDNQADEANSAPTSMSCIDSHSQSVAGQDDIAIIGMSGRFPGADNVEKFWQNLCDGEESITQFSREDLLGTVAEELLDQSDYVKARGIMTDVDLFDAEFFGISPREAEIMDPQQRIFLELCWHALEHAGYSAGSDFDGDVGVFAGMNYNTYFTENVLKNPVKMAQYGEFNTMLASEKDFLTTRVSHKLNLTGPSISLFTACSTSLVAVAEAFEALRNERCSIALAGGISIIVPQMAGYLYQEGSMLSPDGHCRAFDADAKGTTFNSGAGVVVLKRLSQARADGDTIYACIRGVGVNNDGSDKASFTAPGINGQVAAIRAAQAQAGVRPQSISYVETHGTGTPLGDPIEVAALTQAFTESANNRDFDLPGNESSYCGIGSLKSNVGHLVHAAGVASVIKMAFALKHRQLPPSINYSAPNPAIDFSGSPFYVNDRLRSWVPGKEPLRAGISSFGVGGTNAHIIIEEVNTATAGSDSRPCYLLPLSARSEPALENMQSQLAQHLQDNPELSLADVAYTLQRGRAQFNHRIAVVCRDREEAIMGLRGDAPAKLFAGQTNNTGGVVFMYPGQGAQYLGMGSELYAREAVYRDAVDRCFACLDESLVAVLRRFICEASEHTDDAELLMQTAYAQPALFIVGYSLTHLWRSWGIEPQAMIGHSVGEFVAASVAGVFSLNDALGLIVKRGAIMQALPEGDMLSVRLPAEKIETRLQTSVTGVLSIAAISSPKLCVVSGPKDAIAAFQKELVAEQIACRVLHTSHAFHSEMMEPAVEPFHTHCEQLQLSAPGIPIVSTVTGNWLTDEQATDPAYWANHIRVTVNFADAVATAWQSDKAPPLLLEVGPRTTMVTLAHQQVTDRKRQVALASMGDLAKDGSEWTALLSAVAGLWVNGVNLHWSEYYCHERRRRVPLPLYPFQRKRYWLDALAEDKAQSVQPVSKPENMMVADNYAESTQTAMSVSTMNNNESPSRKQQISESIKKVMDDTAGVVISSEEHELTFLQLGLDSLILTQLSLALKNKFDVQIAFRELLEDYSTINLLTDHLDKELPADAYTDIGHQAEAVSPRLSVVANAPAAAQAANAFATQLEQVEAGTAQAVISEQLRLMSRQLDILTGQVSVTQAPVTNSNAAVTPKNESDGKVPEIASRAPEKSQTTSSRMAKIRKDSGSELSDSQEHMLNSLIQRYAEKTRKSKEYAQNNRSCLADPRSVSGFTPLLKEMVYPIVTERAEGSKLWDLDNNEYVDITCGFGVNFFGWSPSFVNDAVITQIRRGIEIGPQSPLAGSVAKKVCTLTNNERASFCNTGSEAVLAAVRLARTVTGRQTIALFSGGYHGIFDEVVVRGSGSLRSFPAAPGIPSSMVENVLVLEYGTEESYQILESRAEELAGVLIEPVQSRCPQIQPEEFLHKVRALTERTGSALIFDEVVTGFRVCPGGAQEYFGIRADLATYGKVVGGGYPIGIVAGKAQYMDALDGGQWSFGDDSIPEVGVTFLAGTFVRQPLALAAADAVLDYLEEQGPEIQKRLNQRMELFVEKMNEFMQSENTGYTLSHFSSWFYITWPEELEQGGLIFYLLREKGIHIWESRPCFFTTAHTDTDIQRVEEAFRQSVFELQDAGFLPRPDRTVKGVEFDMHNPPVEGARLGRNAEGNPAWYIEDTMQSGKYTEVNMQSARSK